MQPMWLGQAPLTVNFHDKSGGNPRMWLWDFGDGQTSDQPNPSHTYAFPGSFTVRLTVSEPRWLGSAPEGTARLRECDFEATFGYSCQHGPN